MSGKQIQHGNIEAKENKQKLGVNTGCFFFLSPIQLFVSKQPLFFPTHQKLDFLPLVSMDQKAKLEFWNKSRDEPQNVSLFSSLSEKVKYGVSSVGHWLVCS